MLEELPIACTKIVVTRFAITVGDEAVTRTFPMTGKQERTFAALARQFLRFVASELLLALAIEHKGQRTGADIT